MLSTLKVSEDGEHALVWDNTIGAQEIREMPVNGYPEADTDARNDARKWIRRQLFDLLRRADDLSKSRIVKGRRVRVIRGRKVPKGTEGVVFWTGVDRFGSLKVGINDDFGVVVWVKMDYLVVVDTRSSTENQYELARTACVLTRYVDLCPMPEPVTVQPLEATSEVSTSSAGDSDIPF